MTSRFHLQNRSYYWDALSQHRRTVALIIAMTVTLPLFAFTSLPPIEVTEEVPQEVEEEIQIPVEVNTTVEVEVNRTIEVEVNKTVEVEVNRTIEVEVNITKEVVLNRTIGVNITEGGSIFLEPQPAPPLIDSDIVLCIDVSGSMDENRMPIAQTAIKAFLELINNSNSLGFSNDRVALVSFAGTRDGDWSNDSMVHASLDFISNQTHLESIFNETDALVGNGWTDAWAGLNASLDLLLENPRNTSTLKSILFLTDGAHNTGPWGVDVPGGNYTGFLTESANFSDSREGGPYSESPVEAARLNNIKIYSIGLFEGLSYEFDENFLRNISLNVTYGAFGDFYAGNDTLSITDSFLQARDIASGWLPMKFNETTIFNNGTQSVFTFNVTSDIRRLKWDLNWNRSEVSFNLTVIDPNGTIFQISENISANIIPVSSTHPKSLIIDFPMPGLWSGNISWSNISQSELIKSRLASFQPPVFIESLTQIEANNGSFSNQSVIFHLNVTNENPLFTYYNITPFILGNFSSYNISAYWDPPLLTNLTTGKNSTFSLNLTFNEPTFLQGTIYFKINCSEGYYDAIAQEVSLDYRITTQNVTIETYTENQTVIETINETIIEFENQTVIETINETIIEIENQTISTIIMTQGLTNVVKYSYNRQVFDTLKWAGFFISLALLMSFLAVYISAHAFRLRNLAKRFRSRIFSDQSALELALQSEGISVAQVIC
ncbi:MAG: vWA domain-containing protein [Candidatus Hodarchaeales archaeon]|jgi:hypothetical protein